MNGHIEIMVQITKRALKALGYGLMTEDAFRTVLGTAEHHVNSRPLGYITTEADELEVLTPRHFIAESAAGMLPQTVLSEGGIPSPYHSAAEKYNALTIAIKAFKEQYFEILIPVLNRINYGPTKDRRGLEVGDVVAMLETNSATGSWPIGIVDEVLKGDDKRVRTVIVRTRGYVVDRKPTLGKKPPTMKQPVIDRKESEKASRLLGYPVRIPKSGKENYYERHVQHLMLLDRADREGDRNPNVEWPDVEEEAITQELRDENQQEGDEPPTPPSRRKAAKRAAEEITRSAQRDRPELPKIPGKRGRPRKNPLPVPGETTPKKRGRPRKVQVDQQPAASKKRGRPRKYPLQKQAGTVWRKKVTVLAKKAGLNPARRSARLAAHS
jgi:hypothetical protein